MNEIKNNFIQLRDDLALTDAERSHMRGVLEALSAPLLESSSVPSPFFFFGTQMRFAMAAFFVVVIGAGSTSALAGGALPGDTLYSVKVHVNENVERSLAYTPEGKANIDIKHAEERLSEVELLAARGDTNEAMTKHVAEEVAKNVARASDTAHDLSNTGEEAKADAIQARIASALLAHADILDAQAGALSDDDSGRRLRALSFAVSATADEADVARHEDAGIDDNPTVATEVVLEREAKVKTLIAALTKALAAVTLPEETESQLTTELASIEADYGETRELIAAEEYDDAGASYEKIAQRAYRALALLRSAKRINETTGKEVVITLENSRSSKDEGKTMLMKAAATLAAPVQNQEAISGDATETMMLKQGNDDSDNTLQFRVRARSWNP